MGYGADERVRVSRTVLQDLKAGSLVCPIKIKYRHREQDQNQPDSFGQLPMPAFAEPRNDHYEGKEESEADMESTCQYEAERRHCDHCIRRGSEVGTEGHGVSCFR